MEKRDIHMHIDIMKKLYFMDSKYDVLIKVHKVHRGLKVVIVEDKDEPYLLLITTNKRLSIGQISIFSNSFGLFFSF